MGTISETVQHQIESVRQKRMRLDELMQPGRGDAADYFREGDMEYRTTELKVPAVVQPQIDSTAATPSQTTFEELMQVLDIIPRQSHMPQATSRQGSSQMRLGLDKPQVDNHIVSLKPDGLPDSSQEVTVTPLQPVNIHPSV